MEKKILFILLMFLAFGSNVLAETAVTVFSDDFLSLDLDKWNTMDSEVTVADSNVILSPTVDNWPRVFGKTLVRPWTGEYVRLTLTGLNARNWCKKGTWGFADTYFGTETSAVYITTTTLLNQHKLNIIKGGVKKWAIIPNVLTEGNTPHDWVIEWEEERVIVKYDGAVVFDTLHNKPSDGTEWGIPIANMAVLLKTGTDQLLCDKVDIELVEIPGSSQTVLFEDDFPGSSLDMDKWDYYDANGVGYVEVYFSFMQMGIGDGFPEPRLNSKFKVAPANDTEYIRLDFQELSTYRWNQHAFWGLSSTLQGTDGVYISLCTEWTNQVAFKIKSTPDAISQKILLPFYIGMDDMWNWAIERYTDKVVVFKDGVVVLDTSATGPDSGGIGPNGDDWFIPTNDMGVWFYCTQESIIVNKTTVTRVTKSDPRYTSCEDVWAYGLGMATDINKDCVVDMKDIADLSEQWLSCIGSPILCD